MNMTKEYIVTALTENQVGVLNRITTAYLRRKINIESLKVNESSVKGLSMFVITCNTTSELIDKVVKQLVNIVDVIEAKYFEASEVVHKEIALFRLALSEEVLELISKCNLNVIEKEAGVVICEKSGTREDIARIKELLESKEVLLDYTSSGGVFLQLNNNG